MNATPLLSQTEVYLSVKRSLEDGDRLASIFATDDVENGLLRIIYLTINPGSGRITRTMTAIDRYKPKLASLAALDFSAGRFEREMADLFGVELIGHPQPMRLVKHAHWPEEYYPLRKDAPKKAEFPPKSGGYPFVEVKGDSVYEIPVGPIHAGMIEPGHFRFSAVGESILKMKARLWFVHRGIEKLMENQGLNEAITLAEKVSGDTSAGHSVALTRAIEDALGVVVDPEIEELRICLVELEAAYNHVNDVGAIANDVGLGIINAHALNIKEALLRINKESTGTRLLRGTTKVSETTFKSLPDPAKLGQIEADLEELVEILFSSSVAMDRFVGAGYLSNRDALRMGCTGYVAMASGIKDDLRDCQYPTWARPAHGVAPDGDVLARLNLRIEGAKQALEIVRNISTRIAIRQRSQTSIPLPDPRDEKIGVSALQGWRGRIVHSVIVKDHRILRAKIVDPSFMNWPALAVALEGSIVADFPLVNKSFNLSYAGNDL